MLLVSCSNREMKEMRNCEGVWSWREWSEGVGTLRLSFVDVKKRVFERFKRGKDKKKCSRHRLEFSKEKSDYRGPKGGRKAYSEWSN